MCKVLNEENDLKYKQIKTMQEGSEHVEYQVLKNRGHAVIFFILP